MDPTSRDTRILQALYRYRFLLTAQIRDVVAVHDHDCSITRRRLRRLEFAKLIRRRHAEIGVPANTSTAPIWSLTNQGGSTLFALTGDALYQAATEPRAAWVNLNHNVRCSQLVIQIDQALSKQEQVRMTALYFDSDLVQPNAQEPSEKFKLYTDVSTNGAGNRKVICVPDFAFEIETGPVRRGYLCEYETGSDGSPFRIAAKKSPGMAGMALTEKWRRIFPTAQGFAALMFVPNPGWREAIRKAMRDKPGSELWRFAAVNELNGDSILTGNVFYTVSEGPRPFIFAQS